MPVWLPPIATLPAGNRAGRISTNNVRSAGQPRRQVRASRGKCRARCNDIQAASRRCARADRRRRAMTSSGEKPVNAATSARSGPSLPPKANVDRIEATTGIQHESGDYTAKQALANAAKANVDRIEATKGFTRIVAPFDGIVTARNTDVGALINPGSTAGGQPLFVVSDVKKLRVYVQVPQTYVPSIPPGATAQMTVPEYAGRTFTAKVESSAQAVNANSGSTLIQLSVDNADGKLMPGSFTSVRFNLDASATALRVPASALIFNGSGLHLATMLPFVRRY
ncbi:MAG: hypothetical protein WDW36_008412 [Sanguina aurantia]